jgi:outer membrane protein TolC
MKPRRYQLVVFALALVFGGPLTFTLVHAQEAATLSLKQAVEHAVAGNPDLRRERVAVASARAAEMGAAGTFDVRLDGAFGISRELAPPSTCPPLCQDGDIGKTRTTTLSLGVARNLESGGSLRLGGQASQESYNFPGVTPGTIYSSGLALTFLHPLLRGLGSDATLAQLHKAQVQTDMASLQRQMRACNVIRDVIVAYWELAYATQNLAIVRSALELAQEQLHTTQAMIAVGRLADADAASVERAIAQRMEDVALGEQLLFFRSLDVQRLLGATATAGATLAAADQPSSVASTFDESAEVSRAIEVNPQLRALKLGRRLSEIDLATARNTLRPRLDFVGSVGPVGWKPRLDDSLKQTAKLGDLAWSAGLTFELPVQNRSARGQAQVAEEGLDLATINAEDFALHLRDLVLRAARSARTSSQRGELGRREVEFAKQNLDAERARFHAGRATNNDVLLRQQELKDAETRLLRATIDQSEAEVALAAATADVLDEFGVVLGP